MRFEEAVAKFTAWCDHHINIDSWAELNAAVRGVAKEAAIMADEGGGDIAEAEIDRLLPPTAD